MASETAEKCRRLRNAIEAARMGRKHCPRALRVSRSELMLKALRLYEQRLLAEAGSLGIDPPSE